MPNPRVPDLNKVLIAGRLTRDPELKYTTNNKPYCRIAIANTRYYRSGEERKEETTFVDVSVWGPQAEYIGERLKKGRPVLIEGSLRTNEWTTQDGQKRQRMEINAQRVTPLDWDDEKPIQASTGGEQGGYVEHDEVLNEDDIPF